MEDLLNEYIPQHEHASLGRRYLGAFIDYAIYAIIYFVLVYSFGDPEISPDGSVFYHLSGMPAFLVIVGTWAVLGPIIESLNNGQSIGKAIVGVRTMKMDGTKAGFDNIVARHLFDWVDFLPFFGIVGVLVASGNKDKQRVGDLVGKTIVVSSRRQ